MAQKATESKLNALYTDNEENVKVDLAGVNAIDVDITLIDRNPDQPRKVFNEEALREMSNSIATYGVLQPLLVTENNGRYLIIAGERRFRAAYMAGLKRVPVIVRELTNQQIQEIALIENLHREDLNAIEAAEGMRELMENHGLTQEAVATRIGKSRPYVTNTLRLLQLPKEVTDLVKEGHLSPGHARALISIDDKDYLVQLANQAVASRLSVRELETKVRLYFTRKSIPFGPRKQPLPIELKEMVSDMK
ncbi:MAG: ParB/RepB/Spo0J family partition protein [Clostridia bacterium]|nr:ParB/RepB/Spo0J family partition protein [Clostridia bacterium]